MSDDKTGRPTSPLFHRIATDLYDPEQVLKAIETQKRRERPEMEAPYVAPRHPLEAEMAELRARTGLPPLDDRSRPAGSSCPP